MELIVIFIVCGALFSMSLVVFPAWNAFWTKHTLKLIDAIGTLVLWGFWVLIVLVWLGVFERPYWL